MKRLRDFKRRVLKDVDITPKQFDDGIQALELAFEIFISDTSSAHNISLDPLGRFSIPSNNIRKMVKDGIGNPDFIRQVERKKMNTENSRFNKLLKKYGLQREDLKRGRVR